MIQEIQIKGNILEASNYNEKSYVFNTFYNKSYIFNI